MSHFDVFNGDADGICALHQLRLSQPQDSTLITGVKRDIALVEKVSANTSDSMTVLDISLDKNREALQQALDRGVQIEYFDHHYAGEIPDHDGFNAHINTSPEVCTSILVDQHLQGAHRLWAIVGAYGDNLMQSARKLADAEGLNEEQNRQLLELGTLLNYNGYGTSLEDLMFDPKVLYQKLSTFNSPFDFIAAEPAFGRLKEGYETDMANIQDIPMHAETATTAVFVLPDEPWARRVSGVYGNELSLQHPGRAHALITELEDGYRISVRAPQSNKSGADTLCRTFPTGGGRAGAAGINLLPANQLSIFIESFQQAW